MSSDEIVVHAQNLNKCFHIYDRPQDRLKQAIVPRLERMIGRRNPHTYARDFWALNNISFDIKRGETVGIVGRNGAGKSTLLQILCGTLSPTSGDVEIRGRVAALLELGAGFNPEFTGRENVYMNGSVLGLSSQEITERFDSIAAFADIGDFINQPVKTYSSGMYVRLAFAVIAHVDADILVIDEALAVGDAVFTQKCMRFLRDFKERGTLIFVSHDNGSVLNLCETALWLQKGSVALKGSAEEVIKAYVKSNLQEIYGQQASLSALPSSQDDSHVVPQSETTDAAPDGGSVATIFDGLKNSAGWATGKAEIEMVAFTDASGCSIDVIQGGEDVRLVIRARAHETIVSPILGFYVKDRLGQALFGEHTFTHTPTPLKLSNGQQCEANFQFRLPLLPNGNYAVTVSFAEGSPEEHVQHHWLHEALVFNVASSRVRHGLVGIPFRSVTLEAC
ncbi:ABC transporter ATP-binding protein [Cupriavidus basilensis]|uniref:ABC transporter ATP-binding protein n=1 Tax=Cupriavidus basilensis TaxID=68895 RepID=UPI0023E849D1|nr:ABC transporter ATP-binding protein [Cupriavidus basilensis]MDF3886549.1 ABC transporter ATP-binding protein [Cupriavidus basilensis]